MKPDTHPKSQLVVFHDTSCDKKFLIASTYQTTDSTEFEGKQYPVCKIDTSSASHPVFTGKKRKAASEGKVAKFRKKYRKTAEASDADAADAE